MKISGSVEGLRISDMVGMVFGYSLAALLARAFLPDVVPMTPAFLAAIGSTYLWLGLAMSGPVVLTFDRWRRNPDPSNSRTPPVRHTRAELCWLLIGGYWLVITGFLAATRLPGMTWPLLFFFPGVGIVIVGLSSLLRSPARVTPTRAWTHWAAVGLLNTWPIVWAFLVVISRSL